MSLLAISADEIFSENEIKKRDLLLIKDNVFAGFISYEEAILNNIEINSYPDCKILPGLFDSHIHGAMGKDTMDANKKSLDIIGEYLLSKGTTSWLPTTVTDSIAKIDKAISNLSVYQESSLASRVFGCFVEGPYLTEEHRGAHAIEFLRDLSIEEFDKLLSSGPVKAIAIAPEKIGSVSFIKHAVEKNVHVSLAHTNASYEVSMEAINNGADAVVHTFCGMSTLHHRKPNLLGAALTCDEVYTELIADGIHVKKAAMEILRRCKPKDKLILVSDAISATGLPDGEYVLGAEKITVTKGISRTSSGSLAGSTTVLLDEVRRFIFELGEEPLIAVNMASLNPSKRFGLDKYIGSINKGKLADFLVVDKEYKIKEVWKDGKLIIKGDSY